MDRKVQQNQVDYTNVQKHIEESRQARTLKLHRNYQREWRKTEEVAMDKLHKSIKNKDQAETFVENRISVMNHGEKYR